MTSPDTPDQTRPDQTFSHKKTFISKSCHFHPCCAIQAMFRYFPPFPQFPTVSSNFLPFPTILASSSNLQPIQSILSNVHPFPEMFSHFQLFPTIQASYSHLQPFQRFSSMCTHFLHFYPFPFHSINFQPF